MQGLAAGSTSLVQQRNSTPQRLPSLQHTLSPRPTSTTTPLITSITLPTLPTTTITMCPRSLQPRRRSTTITPRTLKRTPTTASSSGLPGASSKVVDGRTTILIADVKKKLTNEIKHYISINE